MIIKKVMPKIPVAKKRVAAYCRVSTFRNEQDESFETQQKYYEELIQSHPDWELVKVYADRHSATRVKNRPGFQEMAAAAEAKKLDIIICKSISRFSRNMVDCQQYAKWFRTLGVTSFLRNKISAQMIQPVISSYPSWQQWHRMKVILSVKMKRLLMQADLHEVSTISAIIVFSATTVWMASWFPTRTLGL